VKRAEEATTTVEKTKTILETKPNADYEQHGESYYPNQPKV
jgi:hypothetical protein